MTPKPLSDLTREELEDLVGTLRRVFYQEEGAGPDEWDGDAWKAKPTQELSEAVDYLLREHGLAPDQDDDEFDDLLDGPPAE